MLPNHLSWFLEEIASYDDEIALINSVGETCSYTNILRQFDKSHSFLNEHFSTTPRLITRLSDNPSAALFLATVCHSGCVIPTNPKQNVFELKKLIEDSKAHAIVIDQETPEITELAEKFDLGIVIISYGNKIHFADFGLQWIRLPNSNYKSSEGCALILQTSGSTGEPKSVPITSKALEVSTRNIIQTLQLSEYDRVVHMLPLFHIGAILDLFLVPLYAGGQVHLAHPISNENLFLSLQDPEVTWFQAVPTMLNGLVSRLREPELIKLSSRLRFIRSVSADLAPVLHQEIEERLGHIPVVQMYGMTETAGQIASNPVSIEQRKIGTVGTFSRQSLIIMDPYGNEVAQGKSGEICVRGDTVTRGYLNTAPQETFLGQWLKTGDLGSIDEEGFLTLQGRKKDIVNRGGEKISPVEIEQCLYRLADIKEACVVAIKHQSLGEDIACSIVLKATSKLNEDDVRTHLSKYLSDHKVPRKVTFMDALPKLGSGKLNRKEITALLSGKKTETTKKIPVSKLAKIWMRTLNKDHVHPEDDFFDQGGDSLMAQTFILEIEDRFGITLSTNFLYETSTYSDLEKALAKNTSSKEQESFLPDDAFSILKSLTASWKGSRKTESSLIVAQNTAGQHPPLFFCAADEFNYIDLVKELGPERPFYAMRSLSATKQETPENVYLLAKQYAYEIIELQKTGPIFLGGFCKGAYIAKRISDELAKMGRKTDLLLVIDYTNPITHHGPALVAWSNTSEYSARLNFHKPEQGLKHLFKDRISCFDIDANHLTCTRGTGAKVIVQHLEKAIEDISPPPPSSLQRGGNSLLERQNFYHAQIKLSAPLIYTAGQETHIKVKVTNLSPLSWQPSEISGLRLLAKWQRPMKRTIHKIAGYCDITEEVKPGETTEVMLNVVPPKTKSMLTLFVDMADDGVAWFSAYGSKPARRKMLRRYWIR